MPPKEISHKSILLALLLVLEINSLALSDAGVYNCSVSNVVGMDMRSVRLEVRGEGVS